MCRNSKYKGGSKIVPFRLPIDNIEEATSRIYAILKEYEEDKTIKPTKKTIDTKKPKQCKDVVYTCGCTLDKGLFRREAGCKIERSKHKV